ncbi:MAG: hypothetical protein NC548_27590 [Lachnospiraceae bacterium]|nr:hypothetical protein [Lachnospiraceae bacterium]
MQKMFKDLTPAVSLEKADLFAVEQADGTKQATFGQICESVALPDVAEQTAEFPEIKADDDLKTVAGKIVKWQQDAIKKIEAYILQSSIIQDFPEAADAKDAEDQEAAALKKKVISGLLAYTMNEKILKVVSDHGELAADYEILKREQMASYGYYGVEWNIDDLMKLVKAGKWDKFAVGDYFVETNTAGEKILFEVTGKNSYLHCGDTELSKPHIVASPRDCLETYYKYNTTNTNAGGYAASLMPANLETEANKFTSKLQGYMTQIRRLENNKGAWAWASRRIFLPGNPELVGFHGWADQYDGGAFNQLPLFAGGNAHILKGAGFNKKKAARMWSWTADPSAANTASFCFFHYYGASHYLVASADGGVAPLIVLS